MVKAKQEARYSRPERSSDGIAESDGSEESQRAEAEEMYNLVSYAEMKVWGPPSAGAKR
jgi:hypothetical protein